MIHRGHNCPAEPVVVSIEGVDAPEGRAFVSALVQVMTSFCTVRIQADGNVLHAPGGCPDVVLVIGPGNSRQCVLRTSPGPLDSQFGDAAEIAVLDPSHPEAPRRLRGPRQLPALAKCMVCGNSPFPRPFTVFRLRTIRIRKQPSTSSTGCPATASGWTARTRQWIPWRAVTATASWLTIPAAGE